MQFLQGPAQKCFGKPDRAVSFTGHICGSDARLVVAHRQKAGQIDLGEQPTSTTCCIEARVSTDGAVFSPDKVQYGWPLSD
ncbi:uncharacterized protein J3R85_003131 [Psidium guajava]|nr:uncharacterized protein J3R85_003131 [Psidium guajava]